MAPNKLTLDPHKQNLYFTFDGGFGKVNVITRLVDYLTDVASDSYGHVDGPIASARFSSVPMALKFITNTLILDAAHLNNVLRIIALHTGNVSTVCTSVAFYNQPSTGNVAQCTLLGPKAIEIQPHKNRIMIGSSVGLGYLSYQGRVKSTTNKYNCNY